MTLCGYTWNARVADQRDRSGTHKRWELRRCLQVIGHKGPHKASDGQEAKR